jgi:hypothetical protein
MNFTFVKRNLPFVCLFALCNLTLFGQTGQHPRILQTTETSTTHVPPEPAPPNLEVIYSNLANSKISLYNPGDFLTVGCDASVPVSVGMPFTPKSDSHVEAVRVPVEYQGNGANQVNFSIYTDQSGVPGSLVAGPITVTDLPHWGTCCTLDSAIFNPVAVTGGVQYWVVADTPLSGIGSDFCGLWDFVARPPVPMAVNVGAGWGIDPTIVFELAGEVLGTIP